MIVEIIRKCTAVNHVTSVASTQVLTRAKRVEAQRSQMVMLESMRENKNIDAKNACKKQIHPNQIQKVPPKPRSYCKQSQQQCPTSSKQLQNCKYPQAAVPNFWQNMWRIQKTEPF